MRKLYLLSHMFLIAAMAAAQAPAPPQPPVSLLVRNIDRIIQNTRADWGIYVKSLDTGEEVAINADAVMDTMSVIKVPLLIEAFRQLDAGKVNLADRITIQRGDKRFGTGVLRTLDDGLSLTVKDALTLMIIQSDNSATDMIFARVGGPERVTQSMHDLGFPSITATGTSFDWFRALGVVSDPAWTKLNPEELFTRGYPQTPTRAADVERFHFDGKTPYGLASARDMGHLWEKLAKKEVASPQSCTEMLRILGLQQMNTRIPKYLAGANTPHKTGDFPPFIANDVGLIETPRARVIIVIFNAHHRGIYANLEDAVARVSEQVWAYFNYRGDQAAK
jgi:beta-lactamase class A